MTLLVTLVIIRGLYMKLLPDKNMQILKITSHFHAFESFLSKASVPNLSTQIGKEATVSINTFGGKAEATQVMPRYP